MDEIDDPLMLGGNESESQTLVTSPGAVHRVRAFSALSPALLLAHQARVHMFRLYVRDNTPMVEIQKPTIRRMIPRY